MHPTTDLRKNAAYEQGRGRYPVLMALRIPIEIHDKLRDHAKERGTTVSGFVRDVLAEQIDERPLGRAPMPVE